MYVTVINGQFLKNYSHNIIFRNKIKKERTKKSKKTHREFYVLALVVSVGFLRTFLNYRVTKKKKEKNRKRISNRKF